MKVDEISPNEILVITDDALASSTIYKLLSLSTYLPKDDSKDHNPHYVLVHSGAARNEIRLMSLDKKYWYSVGYPQHKSYVCQFLRPLANESEEAEAHEQLHQYFEAIKANSMVKKQVTVQAVLPKDIKPHSVFRVKNRTPFHKLGFTGMQCEMFGLNDTHELSGFYVMTVPGIDTRSVRVVLLDIGLGYPISSTLSPGDVSANVEHPELPDFPLIRKYLYDYQIMINGVVDSQLNNRVKPVVNLD